MTETYDLWGPDVFPEIFSHPYPFYHRLRAHDPVHIDGHLGCWVVTSYAANAEALANRSLSSERSRQNVMLRSEGWNKLDPLFQHIAQLMFFADPPTHTRIRSHINKAFAARMIEKWRTSIQQSVNDLLDIVQHQGSMEVMKDVALPLPMQTMLRMFGIPERYKDQLKRWSDDMVYFLGNPPTLEHCTKLMQSIQESITFFRTIVQEHRKRPGDDLIDVLLQSEDHGYPLTEEEILINCLGIFGGGHETTTNLIGNCLLTLIRHPDQLFLLRQEPTLIENTIEEALRYESPVQFTARRAKQTTEIGGKTIYQGQSVMLMLGAANRDPARFVNPDVFDIHRPDIRTLAFGHNIHYCIGAALGRLEAQIAIATILKRMNNIHLLADTIEWQQNLSFHGVKQLPISFSSIL